jgi:hypothetical protein
MNVLRIGRVLPGVALLCLFTACGGGNYDKSSADLSYAATDSTAAYPYDPKTSEVPTQRLMIRKAEMNFKVKELQKTSQKITTITNNYGGEIWDSHLKTEVQNTITKKLSADSLLEVITHRQTNDLLIRVPSKNLDSLLNSLEELSQLLYNKEVTSENVSLDYLANELKAKNMARTQERHEDGIEHRKGNLEQYTGATYSNLEIQNNVVDRQIENMSMLDKVKYSTVKVSIYQDVVAYQNVIPNLNSERFGPGFGASALMALQDGWAFMLDTLIFLIRIWPLYFIATAIFFLIRYIDKLFRPKTAKVFVEKN